MIQDPRRRSLFLAAIAVVAAIIMVFPHVLGPMAKKSPFGIRLGAAISLALCIAYLVPSIRRKLDEW